MIYFHGDVAKTFNMSAEAAHTQVDVGVRQQLFLFNFHDCGFHVSQGDSPFGKRLSQYVPAFVFGIEFNWILVEVGGEEKVSTADKIAAFWNILIKSSQS